MSLVVGSAMLFGCDDEQEATKHPSSQAAEARDDTASSATPPAPARAEASAFPPATQASKPEPVICPDGTKLVAGGTFWVGSPQGEGSEDEHPHYKTELADFCMGKTEVTVKSYLQCVEAGECTPPQDDRYNCNTRGKRARDGREKHPVNCVSHHQAKAYCTWKKQRLPTEAEWEYAARGGDRQWDYPWGNESPDGRTCWKHGGSCEVKSFDAGAFGLYDMSGNVWEWTQDWYGAYPWPPVDAWARVYRGGSWSRRFEKWMRTRLRNREFPRKWGSHLGFRCAVTPGAVECPEERTEDGLGCIHVVLDRPCPNGESFNGARCAKPDEPQCPKGKQQLAGHGCVVPGAGKPDYDPDVDTSGVTRRRSPEHDADCQKHQRSRPDAYRYEGGTHKARNVVGRRAGCKNRDVGVGWNSACCP